MVVLRLTEEDIKECFNLYDTDGSGELDREEVGFALRSLGWEQVQEKDLNEFMSAVDASGDGKISFEEFNGMMQKKMLAAGGDEEIQHMFKVFDFDKNGRIGVKDLERIAEKVDANMTTQQISEIINWGDFDQDGQLNYEEFHNTVTKYQTSFDPRSKRATQWAEAHSAMYRRKEGVIDGYKEVKAKLRRLEGEEQELARTVKKLDDDIDRIGREGQAVDREDGVNEIEEHELVGDCVRLRLEVELLRLTKKKLQEHLHWARAEEATAHKDLAIESGHRFIAEARQDHRKVVADKLEDRKHSLCTRIEAQRHRNAYLATRIPEKKAAITEKLNKATQLESSIKRTASLTKTVIKKICPASPCAK